MTKRHDGQRAAALLTALAARCAGDGLEGVAEAWRTGAQRAATQIAERASTEPAFRGTLIAPDAAAVRLQQASHVLGSGPAPTRDALRAAVEGLGESAVYLGKDGRWHARVPMGYKDDGTPYRRHLTRPTRKELVDEVRRLEKQRDEGSARQPGEPWTVAKWLEHWVENIARPVVSENTYAGYEVAVRVHLVPGIGRHRIDRLEPEHLESLYRWMQSADSKAGTAQQAHRTARTALGEAVRRGHAAKNAAALAKPPRMEEDETEVEPYSVDEVQSLLLEVPVAAEVRARVW